MWLIFGYSKSVWWVRGSYFNLNTGAHYMLLCLSKRRSDRLRMHSSNVDTMHLKLSDSTYRMWRVCEIVTIVLFLLDKFLIKLATATLLSDEVRSEWRRERRRGVGSCRWWIRVSIITTMVSVQLMCLSMFLTHVIQCRSITSTVNPWSAPQALTRTLSTMSSALECSSVAVC